MTLRGERVQLDFDEILASQPSSTSGTGALLRDVVERPMGEAPKPPSAPSLGQSANGFPAPRERARQSKFRRNLGNNTNKPRDDSSHQDQSHRPQGVKSDLIPVVGSSQQPPQETTLADVKRSIDEENNDRITQMSDDEIKQAQADLRSMLSPSLIERLLKKADIDDDASNRVADPQSTAEVYGKAETTSKKSPIQANVNSSKHDDAGQKSRTPEHDPDVAPSKPPADLQPASSFQAAPVSAGVHFPSPPAAPPDLDPSSPDFLDQLQKQYFPSLSADPSTLAWMKPIDNDDPTGYSAENESLPASMIRFDFRGRLLPPRLASEIPTTKGLHHHGHAPGSAGYTIPELAHLARSAVPAQRCAAYQTLGRILYRLGRGDFGGEGGDLHDGLWACVTQGRVLDGMIEAAGQSEGHRSVWATATEAIWLWRKGGGRTFQGR